MDAALTSGGSLTYAPRMMRDRGTGLGGLDLSRAMRTDDELLELVEAIYGSSTHTQETNWLEWKDGIDPAKPEGKMHIAKALLGFANRSVDQAQLACEGVAYMVVGVSPGACGGVTPIDHANLDQAIKSYVATVRWTPRYVAFRGLTVLVAVVEAPRPGDRIHTLRKEFGNHGRGKIFHRGAALTTQAGPDEIEMLCERLLQGAQQPEIDLRFSCGATPLKRLNTDDAILADWLLRHEAIIRRNSGSRGMVASGPAGGVDGRHDGSPASELARTFEALGAASAHAKDAEEFDSAVQDYLERLRPTIVDRIRRRVVTDRLNRVVFQVLNETESSMSGVQLTVQIPKSDIQVYTSPPHAPALPSRPKWPNTNHHRVASLLAASFPAQALPSPAGIKAKVIRTKDFFEITWPIGNVRPGESSARFAITVVPGPTAPGEVAVTMTARAMDRRGACSAHAAFAVSDEFWSIDDFFDANSPG